jgi:Ser/Thr protein kinase RdoA (MazF antagonist)
MNLTPFMDIEAAALRALGHYPLDVAGIEPLGHGLINRTFQVRLRGGGCCVLQRVNPIFAPEVNDDIEAVTAQLAGNGLLTPRLVRTRSDALYVIVEGEVWRVLTYVDGTVFERLDSAARAREAGALLGRFHAALADLVHEFRSRRPGVHDIARHLSRLRETLDVRGGHPRFRDIEPLGRSILEAAATLPPLPALPSRIVHGDPKISNILFDRGTGAALCLVDLDTLAHLPAPLELGDALRSWCNRAGEDTRETEFDPTLFHGALQGYAGSARHLLTPAECDAIVPALLTICVELAARFCSDALNEDYFAWDDRRFTSHSEHSEVRAAGQIALWTAVRARQAELAEVAARAFR